MNAIQITAAKLIELLGIDKNQGIFDITMNAWDTPETIVTITTCAKSDLPSVGLH